MTEPSSSSVRDAQGRFVPGCSGNPAGKKPGTQNWSTRVRGVRPYDDADTVMRRVVARALADSPVDSRFLFAWIEPKPRGRPVEVVVPDGASLVERCQAVFAAMARGDITTSEAAELARVIDTERKAGAFAAGAPADAALRAETAPPPPAELAPVLPARGIPAPRGRIIAQPRPRAP